MFSPLRVQWAWCHSQGTFVLCKSVSSSQPFPVLLEKQDSKKLGVISSCLLLPVLLVVVCYPSWRPREGHALAILFISAPNQPVLEDGPPDPGTGTSKRGPFLPHYVEVHLHEIKQWVSMGIQCMYSSESGLVSGFIWFGCSVWCFRCLCTGSLLPVGTWMSDAIRPKGGEWPWCVVFDVCAQDEGLDRVAPDLDEWVPEQRGGTRRHQRQGGQLAAGQHPEDGGCGCCLHCTPLVHCWWWWQQRNWLEAGFFLPFDVSCSVLPRMKLVCVRERGRERERVCVCVLLCVCVTVMLCVCGWGGGGACMCVRKEGERVTMLKVCMHVYTCRHVGVLIVLIQFDAFLLQQIFHILPHLWRNHFVLLQVCSTWTCQWTRFSSLAVSWWHWVTRAKWASGIPWHSIGR